MKDIYRIFDGVDKLFDCMKNTVLFKVVDEEYLTLNEYVGRRKNKAVYCADNKDQRLSILNCINKKEEKEQFIERSYKLFEMIG